MYPIIRVLDNSSYSIGLGKVYDYSVLGPLGSVSTPNKLRTFKRHVRSGYSC